ncbi:LacI family DNA-binding transcriptional regulator [Clostridium perfringens]|uniref:LacI family DNA-binding transcriptional regulator n=1 Tax=Clostridium perfringens TaxID=1502 RepID=UPI0022462544|nr:LacI family DNA-binding transcriptional regulator [Clostridium perfringens]MCX0391991.1 LacI family DNA-binding transcriptional regulator [Clostridium perfringens]
MTTIKDVAKRAGVSVGTVSNVINNVNVKSKNKELVEKAIKELNYKPNVYARGLKLNKTNTVALILPTVWDPFLGELAYYIEKNLRNYNYKMILCNSENDYMKEIEYINMVKQNKVDGIISITYSNIDPYISANIPLVSIDRFFTKTIPYVSSDNLNGGRLAAEELVKAGCKKLAIIGRGSEINNSTRNRVVGFIDYCKKNNIDYDDYYYVGHSKSFNNFLNEFILENFEDKIKFDGIFVITDSYAIDLIEKLKELNINVPNDVQIIGYDGAKTNEKDLIKISTIRQPLELIAEKAVYNLNKVINKETISKETLLPVKFIKGYTTK